MNVRNEPERLLEPDERVTISTIETGALNRAYRPIYGPSLRSRYERSRVRFRLIATRMGKRVRYEKTTKVLMNAGTGVGRAFLSKNGSAN